MAWANSGIFTNTIKDICTGTALDLDADTFYVALYDNTTTPAFDAASASTYYNSGQWVSATYEVFGTNWAAGGVTAGGAMTLTAASPGAGQLKFDFAGDISVATTTVSDAYGCLVYDQTDANDQGICAVYFGGTAYSTVAGTFAITWDTNGVFYLDLVP